MTCRMFKKRYARSSDACFVVQDCALEALSTLQCNSLPAVVDAQRRIGVVIAWRCHPAVHMQHANGRRGTNKPRASSNEKARLPAGFRECTGGCDQLSARSSTRSPAFSIAWPASCVA